MRSSTGLAPNPRGDGRRQRIGLLGGSFNPAHAGHVHISKQAIRHLRLDQVWWLVSPQNPLKSDKNTDLLINRIKGAEALLQRCGDRRILVTDLESRMGTRYTADTLDLLQVRFPHARFVWLMGADNLAQLPRWRRWRRIMARVPVAIFDRSPYSGGALAGVAAQSYRGARIRQSSAGLLAEMTPPAWVYLPIARHPASSTAIRRAQGRDA